MTHLDDQINNKKAEIKRNRYNAERFGVPTHYSDEDNFNIAGLEEFLLSATGNRRAEGNQLLSNMKILRDLEEQNIHELKNYQFVSSQFGEFQIQAESIEEAQIKFNEWEREQELLQPVSDPSIGSAFDEDPIPEIQYPLSANVRISFTNSDIGGFSSSIPINDTGELQGLSNASNEWRYTLIGSSTNQPLLTLSGLINMINSLLVSIPEITTVVEPPIEPEPEVTTVDIEPPIEPEEPYVFSKCVDVYRVMNADERDESFGLSPRVYAVRETVDYQTMADYVNVQHLLVRDCGSDVPSDQEVLDYYGVSQPTPTPTPTEERPVKWIPEPFFSFINEVFVR
jgi:hypothetical protein